MGVASVRPGTEGSIRAESALSFQQEMEHYHKKEALARGEEEGKASAS